MSPLTEPTKLTLAKSFTQQPYMWEFPQQHGLWYPGLITTALWLDAADASTITESGGAVSQWNDKSGNGRNAVQTNSANQPNYSASAFNSLPGISFNGTSHFMDMSAQIYSSAFFVIAFTKTTASGLVFGAGDLSASLIQSSSDVRVKSNPNQLFSGFTNTDSIFATDLTSGYWNGSLMTPAGTASSEMSRHLGARHGNSLFYDGNIAELIVTTALVDRQKLEGYLAHKWGLTANLPADHPYKTVGPTP